MSILANVTMPVTGEFGNILQKTLSSLWTDIHYQDHGLQRPHFVVGNLVVEDFVRLARHVERIIGRRELSPVDAPLRLECDKPGVIYLEADSTDLGHLMDQFMGALKIKTPLSSERRGPRPPQCVLAGKIKTHEQKALLRQAFEAMRRPPTARLDTIEVSEIMADGRIGRSTGFVMN